MSHHRRPASARAAALRCAALSTVAVAGLLAAAGCGKDDFAKVNGQVITKDEYIRALERAPVNTPGAAPGSTVNAGRFVLDQLITREIVEAKAAQANVKPTDKEVDARFALQKRIFEQQMPGKSYEEAMKDQGTDAEQVKDEVRFQMAETNLFAQELKISEEDLKKAYEQFKGQMGLPERAQLRVVVVPGGGKEFSQAKKLLDAKTDFAAVAKQVNPVALRANGGLLPQPFPVNTMPPAWQQGVARGQKGSVFGPVDWPAGPGQKAWIKIEEKMAAFTLPFEDAKPLVKQQIVQMRLADPQNANVRNNVLKMKLDANFQASDPKYQAIWDAVKTNARNSGVGQDPGAVGGGGSPVTSIPGG